MGQGLFPLHLTVTRVTSSRRFCQLRELRSSIGTLYFFLVFILKWYRYKLPQLRTHEPTTALNYVCVSCVIAPISFPGWLVNAMNVSTRLHCYQLVVYMWQNSISNSNPSPKLSSNAIQNDPIFLLTKLRNAVFIILFTYDVIDTRFPSISPPFARFLRFKMVRPDRPFLGGWVGYFRPQNRP